MLREYLNKTRSKRNFIKEHVKTAHTFGEEMMAKREMQKQRRAVLNKVAEVYQKEKEDFNAKYRYFQLHKWEILKAVKQTMFENKMIEVHRQRLIR